MAIEIPHKFEPRPYQLPFLEAMDNGKKRAIKTWHRRAGKDKVDFNFMVKKAFEKVGTYFYFLPEYAQAKKVIWDNIDNDGFKMLDHIPAELITNKNKQELKIELVNGSVIQLIGADNFSKSGVGTNPIGVVFSEYSINLPEVWGFVRPILKVNGGWAVFNFTPRGKNHAWEQLQIAKENPDEWFSEVLTIADTGILTKEDIEQELKEGMTQDMVDQEYYCKFIEGASQFFKKIELTCVAMAEEPQASHRYQLGVDLAKYQDYTVISVFDLTTFTQVHMERFNQMDWELVEARIENAYLKWNKGKVYMDSTGVGDPIFERLDKKGLNIVPYKFTYDTRMHLLNNLSLKMQNNIIKMLNDDVLKDELHAFQYELTGQGKIKVKVPDSLHDDTVFATALSIQDMPSSPVIPKSDNKVRYLTKDFRGKQAKNGNVNAE